MLYIAPKTPITNPFIEYALQYDTAKAIKTLARRSVCAPPSPPPLPPRRLCLSAQRNVANGGESDVNAA
jgi:hypothetical protein